MLPFRVLVRSLPLVIAAALPACNSDDLIEPSTGTLEITTATAGTLSDPDGYTVQVDGESPRAIGVSAQLSSETIAGDHSIRLDGVASNCAVEGDNPRQVGVTAGATTTVAFSVTCSSTVGTLVVSSSSTGFFPDPDGYLLTVDGAERGPLGAADQQTLADLSPGIHQIGLSGLIANCRVQGENPRSQAIVGGESATLTFEVECAPPAIAFVSSRSPGSLAQIFLVNPDGSGLVRLPSTSPEYHPVWSPDGRRLAFVALYDLYVMTPGAGDRTRLFPIASAGGIRGSVGQARWSPDGRMIAFDVTVDCEGPPCLREQLWVVNADGTGLRKLAGGSRPDWSPDGRTIAFGNDQGIATIGSDGSGLKQFTVPLLGQPEEATWSPDGSRLAFSAFVSSNPYANAIFTIKPDGTGLVRLTPEWGSETAPQWSPDGSRIAFRAELSGPDDFSTGLGVMNADGSGRSIVVPSVELKDEDFTWSPDGASLAFTVRTDFEIGDDDVYVVNVDGSGRRNLTRNPAGDAEPSWATTSPAAR